LEPDKMFKDGNISSVIRYGTHLIQGRKMTCAKCCAASNDPDELCEPDSIRSAAEKGPGPAAATADDLQHGVHGLGAAVKLGEFHGKSFCRLFNGPGQPFQFTEYRPGCDLQFLGQLFPVAAPQPLRPPLAAQSQGQALVEVWIDGGAKQIVKRRQTHASVFAVEQSDVLAMGIGVADQEIEADPPQQL
jgi:hypothetical protein